MRYFIVYLASGWFFNQKFFFYAHSMNSVINFFCSVLMVLMVKVDGGGGCKCRTVSNKINTNKSDDLKILTLLTYLSVFSKHIDIT